MIKKTSSHRFLALDELSPAVDSASCFNLEESCWWRYRNPSHHLVLIESGRMEARTPNGDFQAKAGDLFCFRPTERNEFGACGPTVYYQASIRFAPPPRHHLTPSLAEFGPLPVHIRLGRAFEEMRRLFETVCIEIAEPGAVHQLRLRAAVLEMLATIASTLTGDRRGVQSLDDWQRLRLHLDTELGADVSVETMARQMNLSLSYFKRAFKQHFGITPRAYHTHARLREAARLLRSTDKQVKAIASELGFHDANVLTRLFKRQLGVSPSDLRQGAAPVAEIAPSDSGRLFPMNKLLVTPPHTAEDWYYQCFPPRRRESRI